MHGLSQHLPFLFLFMESTAVLTFQALTLRKKCGAGPNCNVCVFVFLPNDENQCGQISKKMRSWSQLQCMCVCVSPKWRKSMRANIEKHWKNTPRPKVWDLPTAYITGQSQYKPFDHFDDYSTCLFATPLWPRYRVRYAFSQTVSSCLPTFLNFPGWSSALKLCHITVGNVW